MDVITSELLKLLVPVVAAALLGGAKALYPKFKERVPNMLWPFAVYGLARVGTAACDASGVGCSGNPFAWDETTMQAMAAAFVAMAIREVAKGVYGGDLLTRLKALLHWN